MEELINESVNEFVSYMFALHTHTYTLHVFAPYSTTSGPVFGFHTAPD